MLLDRGLEVNNAKLPVVSRMEDAQKAAHTQHPAPNAGCCERNSVTRASG